ncbi:succinate dehydrogenase flavoprotein subunit, partial [Coemansia sp. RSA 922]
MLSTCIRQRASQLVFPGSRAFHSSRISQRVIGTQPLRAKETLDTLSPRYEIIDHTYDAVVLGAG